MKQIKTWLATIAALLCSLTASAHSFEMDGIYYNITSSANLTVEVTYMGSYALAYDEYEGEVNIPSVVTYKGNTYSVTRIGNQAFYGNTVSFKSVILPASVTAIGDEAFDGCSGLTSITIPINSQLTRIGKYAFENCSNLVSISIPESVTNIENSAFYGCSSLTSVDFSEISQLMSIGDYAFRNCRNLTSMIIPEGVNSIGREAFLGCSSLASIILPQSVTSIGTYAFRGCTGELTVKCNVNSAPSDSEAPFFYSIFNKLIIGDKVTSIGGYAFCSCASLTSITCKAETPPTIGGTSTFSRVNKSIPVYVPAGSLEAYNNAEYWSEFTNIQPLATSDIASGNCGDNLTWKITKDYELIIEGKGTMYDYDYDDSPWIEHHETIRKVTINEGVTSIGQNAFYNCVNLESISIPTSVGSINNQAFNLCSSLNTIIINENNTTYTDNDDNAIIVKETKTLLIGTISGCVPKGLTIIGDYAFGGRNLKDQHIEIPEGIVSIGKLAFCQTLISSIHLPTSLKECKDYAFEFSASVDKSNISKVYIDDLAAWFDIEFVSEGANPLSNGASLYFNGELMESITVPVGVTSIKKYAFEAWSGNEIIIPEEVTSIGEWAFKDCCNLATVTIPKGMTSIGTGAFSRCTSLNSIICKATTPPAVQTYTFDYVDKSIPLYVPTGSVATYKSTEYWNEFTNIQSIVNNVVLLDTQESFAQGEDEECTSIIYTRNFRNTNWQALYVPFEIPVTEAFLADFEVADLNDVRQYDRDDDGVKDETVIEAFKVKSGVLEANYPYLIRAREAGEKTITVTDATLFAAEENSIDCSSVRDKFTFTGTYSRLSSDRLPQGEGYYALSGGVWQPVAAGASLGAFRFYLKVDSRNGVNAAQSNSIRMRIIGEDGEVDGATGIDNSGFNNQNSELIFDLQGRRVENPTKGVYIVNGVKRVF